MHYIYYLSCPIPFRGYIGGKLLAGNLFQASPNGTNCPYLEFLISIWVEFTCAVAGASAVVLHLALVLLKKPSHTFARHWLWIAGNQAACNTNAGGVSRAREWKESVLMCSAITQWNILLTTSTMTPGWLRLRVPAERRSVTVRAQGAILR